MKNIDDFEKEFDQYVKDNIEQIYSDFVRAGIIFDDIDNNRFVEINPVQIDTNNNNFTKDEILINAA
ncbi:MAG: hypothetical protein U9Q83_10415 [Bacteroidota bacterium]|nr:hypothetical protein [Bacteroidota bacterium]